MSFLKRIGAIFYMLIMAGIGMIFLAVLFNMISPETWAKFIDIINANVSYKAALGAIAFLFIIKGLITPYKVERRLKKSRVVAFRNPDGEVTVSLSAIEEYIRKIAKNINGMKDVRSRVNVNKKGINIITDISVFSGANIPEITERFQMEIRNKVQAMLGVEEQINIALHIRKIAKQSNSEEKLERETPGLTRVPFREM